LYNIGVIASEAERKSKEKWYEFWKRDKAEYFYIENYDLSLVITYTSQNIDKIFKREGVENAVFTKLASSQKSFEEINIANGINLFKSLLSDITKKVIKIAGINRQSSSLVIIDEQLSSEAESLIERLYGDFKYITLVTDNTTRASEISKKALDEYGLTIETLGINARANCDIAIKTGSGNAKLPKHTILIDASCEHNKTNKNLTINWVELSKTISLPFVFDSLEITEALEKVCGAKLPHKLSEFKFNGNIVRISQLAKKN